MRKTLLLFLLLAVAGVPHPGAAQDVQPAGAVRETAAAQPTAATPLEPAASLARWFDIHGVAASVRYRGVENAAGTTTTSAMQWSYNARGRVRLDAPARYSLNFVVLTGASFNQSWLSTGLGTGPPHYESGLRQLFLSAEPMVGLTAQVGSMAPARGLSTEITTLDNDGYVFGERVSLKGRTRWLADEIVVTNAYLGQFQHPDLFHRTGNWGDRNYRQVLMLRALSRTVSVSGDYTAQAGAHILHQGMLVSAPSRLWFDGVRVEQYQRIEPAAAYGMAATLEKTLTRRMKAAIGVASIDPDFGTLNGERFGTGHRVFVSGSHALVGPLTASWFYTHEIGAPATATNVQRLDLHLTYDVLAHLKALAK